MKKFVIGLMLLSLCPAAMRGQSSMTDSQVADFVQKEVAKGTSQAQIVTKLMQNGVDITQIRRVRKKYERQANDSGLGTATAETRNADRLRTNNGKLSSKQQTLKDDRLRASTSTQRIQGTPVWEEEYD